MINNKKLGIILLIIGALTGLLIINSISSLSSRATELGCFNTEDCTKLESSLSMSHLAFGVVGFILALGIYLIIFARGEEALLKIVKDDKEIALTNKKFDMLSRGLDKFEKEVIRIIKEQDGITQNTLRIKTDISKAKLSYVLQSLEKKELIKRVKKGKTLALYLRESI